MYNVPLRLYMLAASNGIGTDSKGCKPSYLGIWVASHPSGPWNEFHEGVGTEGGLAGIESYLRRQLVWFKPRLSAP